MPMAFKRRHLNVSSYLFMVSIVVFTAGLAWLPVTERLDNILYDIQLSFQSKPAPDDIVIVAIDQESLNEIGNWPWPRAVHASLLDRLTSAKTKIVIFDVLFTDPDRFNPENDEALRSALKNNGRVVLPVNLEPLQIGGQFTERLPLPEFSSGAVGLGHVNVDLDTDGILRKVNLNVGLGDAFWQHLTYSAAALVQPESVLKYRKMQTANSFESTYSWHTQKDQQYLIPFLGPPGSFTHISYSDVLLGHISPDLLKNKVVLVGATATGLGDYLPTPMTGTLSGMSGVEINANIYDGLRNGKLVSPLNESIQLMILLIGGILYAVVLVFASPNIAIAVSVLMIVLVIVISMFIQSYFKIWYPPAGIIILVLLTYPIWSWLRLRSLYLSFSRQLASLYQEEALTFSEITPSTTTSQACSLQFLAEIFPILAWRVSGVNGEILLSEGVIEKQSLPANNENEWQLSEGYGCIKLEGRYFSLVIEINWSNKEELPLVCLGLVLDAVVAWFSEQRVEDGNFELMEEQARQLESISTERKISQQLLANSLEAMQGGMLILDGRGQIVLANTIAREMFDIRTGKKHPTFTDNWEVLSNVQLEKGLSWKILLRNALVENSPIQTEAHPENGVPLLIDIAPVSLESGAMLVVNVSDVSFIKAVEKERAETIQFLSHDLRSPMVSLLALSEIYKGKKDIGEDELKEVFTQVAFYAKKNLTLMDQFIQLARVESEPSLERNFIDFFEVVEEAALEVDAMVKNKGIKLDKLFETEDTWVSGNMDLLIRIVVNLLSNAIKYSYKSSTVTIRIYTQQGRLYCCVQDFGFGIDHDELEHLFQRFYRSSNPLSRREQGVGLGLNFVQVAVDRLSGDIKVESELGKGSRFTISFPLVDMGALVTPDSRSEFSEPA